MKKDNNARDFFLEMQENRFLREKKLLKNISEGRVVDKTSGYEVIKSLDVSLGLYSVLLGDLDTGKQYLSTSGMMYDFINKVHTTKEEYWLPIDDLAKILLSDNVKVYERLHKNKQMDLGSEEGGWQGMQKAMYEIAVGDWAGLKETVKYIKSVKGKYDNLFHDIDNYFKIYEGFLEKDGEKLEEALNYLEKPKFRKVRMREIIMEKHISIITTALAKMAWMHGMEVEIDSDYVPKSVLPFSPLAEYNIPYRFLRDYYRKEGIDWSYNPVHPELQDWENDPENPNRKKGGLLKKWFSGK